MGFDFKVNETKLRQIALALRNLPMAVRADAGARLLPRMRELVDQQFDRGSGPGGSPWPTAKAGGKKMEKTGALRHGYRFTLVPAGSGISIRIGNAEKYASYLQRGTPRMAPRIQVPCANAPMPREWAEAMRVSYVEAMRAQFSRLPK